MNISDAREKKGCEHVMYRYCLKVKQPNGWEAGTIPVLFTWCNSKVRIVSDFLLDFLVRPSSYSWSRTDYWLLFMSA